MEKFSRILIVNQNWLGDALFSTPAIRALRRRFPQSYIACLAPSRVKDALTHNPHLNEVLEYDERASLGSVFEPLRVWSALRGRRFDAAFFFHRSRSKAFLAKMAGIPVRVGFSNRGKSRFLTQAVPLPAEPMHKIDLFLHLLGQAGIPSDGRHMEMRPTAEEEASLTKTLIGEGVAPQEPYVVVHAGGNWKLKRWPEEHFAQWIRLFLQKNDWKVVLCGAPSEEAVTRGILEKCPGGRTVSVCGKTSLGELAALMKRARLVLSNDSGPIHVAASQQAKVLGLYGPTSPEETGPASAGTLRVLRKDVGCEVPCYFRDCDWRACMELLTPEEVLREAQDLLSI